MRYLSVLVSLFCLALFLGGNAEAGGKNSITVSAAISLKDSFQEIGKLFEKKHKGVKVFFNFGASGTLQAQIEGGAPVDVFASAAPKQMDALEKKGLVVEGTRRNFAGNVLVLIVPSKSKLPIKSFADLEKPFVKRIAIGDPKTVPAGQYSEEVLENLRLWDKLKEKFVYAENVRQVLDYVARNEVDAGLVYLTDAFIRRKQVKIVGEAPKGSCKPVVYPIAVVKTSQNVPLAKDFVALVLSPEGQKILKKYGFKTMKEIETTKTKQGGQVK
ncbi:MAG: molybdate ABC transporter substrate-binding protein [bacterium]